ncbi:MAG: alkaline phosphatase family protein [Pseudomonadota bacterium]|nr:alkaline phosphatase family protein [Pseudomonadota bacterium]
MKILRAALAALALAAGCAATSTPVTPATRPRLVVVLIIDGLPQRQVVDYRDQLAPDGLRRFLDRGAWFANAHYGHAHTVTAPGHATVMTGTHPATHGIISNEWRDPVSGQKRYCVEDAGAVYIGHRTRTGDGTSPRNLRVETVGDALRRVSPASKVIALSAKDRGAILLAGKAGVAYIYQSQSGEFGSTTYYMRTHPGWVDAFNAQKRADRYFGAEWKPLLEDAAYARSLADDHPAFDPGGSLPKRIGDTQGRAGPAFYQSLKASPFIDELTLDFARAAIAGEALGGDDVPDILAVSLSGHDYINHSFAAESRLSHDHVLRVDRMLEGFFRHLDMVVGEGRYAAVLTSDHGFTPLPEHARALGRDSGRFDRRAAFARVEAELALGFGEGPWLVGFTADSLVVDRGLATRKAVAVDALIDEARKLLLAEPGVAAVYTRAELESASRAGAPLFEAMRRTWSRELSGDLQMALKAGWIFSSARGKGTTHGGPHASDTHVPILFYGAPWVTAGRIDTPIQVVDIAPTLATILGIPPPASAEGKTLALH